MSRPRGPLSRRSFAAALAAWAAGTSSWPTRAEPAPDCPQRLVRETFGAALDRAALRLAARDAFWHDDAIFLKIPPQVAVGRRALKHQGRYDLTERLVYAMNRTAGSVAGPIAQAIAHAAAAVDIPDADALLRGPSGGISALFEARLKRGLQSDVARLVAAAAEAHGLDEAFAPIAEAASRGPNDAALSSSFLHQYVADKGLDAVFRYARIEEQVASPTPEAAPQQRSCA